MAEKFTVVGSNIIENLNGEILLVKEGKQVAENLYNLPAGSMETGESPEETAVREALEEAGLEIEPDRFQGVYTDTTETGKEQVLNFVFASQTSEKPEIQQDDTVKDYSWFKPAEIPENQLRADYIKKAVKDWKKESEGKLEKVNTA